LVDDELQLRISSVQHLRKFYRKYFLRRVRVDWLWCALIHQWQLLCYHFWDIGELGLRRCHIHVVHRKAILLRQLVHECRLELHLIAMVCSCEFGDGFGDFVLKCLTGEFGVGLVVHTEEIPFLADQVFFAKRRHQVELGAD